jgi:hypothetical protein
VPGELIRYVLDHMLADHDQDDDVATVGVSRPDKISLGPGGKAEK